MPNWLDVYRVTFPETMDSLSAECIGFYGYGNGRVIAANASGSRIGKTQMIGDRVAVEIVGGCGACPVNGDCWQKTRDRARVEMPELMKTWDEIVITDGITSPRALTEWFARTGQDPEHGVPTPDLVLNIENFKHGSWHTAGMRYTGDDRQG